MNGKVDDKSDNESDDNSSDDEDENSTHPSIDKRLDALHERMDDETKVNKKHFLVSEEAFYFIQKIARFELVRMNLDGSISIEKINGRAFTYSTALKGILSGKELQEFTNSEL